MRTGTPHTIYQASDDDGRIEVIEERGQLILHFGNHTRQSALDPRHPERLQLAYTEAMMSVLLFEPEPQRILLIGLGGGALLHFLHHHRPASRIDVVEKRDGVIRVARQIFMIPDSATLYLGDGAEFIARTTEHYDLILVDAYHDEGMDRGIDGAPFFTACRERLTETGIMSINLWSSQAVRLARSLAAIGRSFDNRVLKLPVKGRGNIIALGFRGPNRPRLRSLKGCAEVLQIETGLPFIQQLHDLRRYNESLFSRLIS